MQHFSKSCASSKRYLLLTNELQIKSPTNKDIDIEKSTPHQQNANTTPQIQTLSDAMGKNEI